MEFVGFLPIVFEDSEILILGSFPSVKSRENDFYYANPQNKFWKTLAYVFETEPPKTKEEKISLCKNHKIALWDVVTKSDIVGSSDTKLSKSIIEVANIKDLLKKHPTIKKVICNGKLAHDLFNSYYNVEIPVVRLPSTSPANVRFDINEWKNNLL